MYQTVLISFGAASAGNRSGCGLPGTTYFIVDPQRGNLPDLPVQGPRTLALLVNEGLTIRRVFRADQTPPSPEIIAEDTKLWRDGSAIA
jgi:hypothetical protein